MELYVCNSATDSNKIVIQGCSLELSFIASTIQLDPREYDATYGEKISLEDDIIQTSDNKEALWPPHWLPAERNPCLGSS